ncbi:hypothetical protein PLESTB_001732100 [Pleodorina starrii]|uniref:Cytochrome c domain-containing protein n=1 Tax=Pleodorina starrii TaxID=330485 RepID=A0A9W6BZN2_9CHLO|nr:hypothetical protein PLESTB_001732100 [Pleodorina starrii]
MGDHDNRVATRADIHVVPYFRACCLLKACASLLRMPPRALATALAYLHQWRRSDAVGDLADDAVMAACLFLATKVEEAATSNNHLLNVVKLVGHLEREQRLAEGQWQKLETGSPADTQHGRGMDMGADAGEDGELEAEDPEARRQRQSGRSTSASDDGDGDRSGTGAAAAAAAAAAALLMLPRPTPANPAALALPLRAAVLRCEVLVGAEYYAAKQAMLDAEQRLLRALQFRVTVRQPHSLLLNAARCLRMPAGVQRLALAILNDLWAYTDLCLLLQVCGSPPEGEAPVGELGGGGGGGGGGGRVEGVEAVLAVLEAAARLSGWEVRVPTHARDAGLCWWQLLGMARDERGMGELVTAVMEACAACHNVASSWLASEDAAVGEAVEGAGGRVAEQGGRRGGEL